MPGFKNVGGPRFLGAGYVTLCQKLRQNNKKNQNQTFNHGKIEILKIVKQS